MLFRSSTWIRDRFGEVLELVDEGVEPMLVTRRGKSGLMLLARSLMEVMTVTSFVSDSNTRA